MRSILLCTFLAAAVYPAHGLDVQELLRESVAATEHNWKDAPNYVYRERDVEEKLSSDGKIKTRTVKTYEVSMIDGTPYRRLLEINDKPISPKQQKAEAAKMEAERKRRLAQSASARANRIAKYEKERKQDQALLKEMADAFDYRLAGEETVDGRETYVLDATPKPGYVPRTRDTKVLTGMRGKLWIDKADKQWVRVEAEVMHPVSFYAIATVSPGTKFVLEQEPVAKGLWMPKHFSVRVNSSILWISRNSLDDERYSDYRRASTEEAERH
jgi:hypothetical protein